LKGFEHYSWVVTIYLLTSTISVPIFGKLSDMYGRKWFYVGGIAVFVIGSALSGISWDIYSLITFRGLQGLGAGVLFASAFAIIADLIPPRDRGKWQGAFGGVWGLASVIGPSVGGFLTDNLSWRWVFYVNVPIGLVALGVIIAMFPQETKHGVKKVIDWLGAATLTVGLGALMLALTLSSQKDWEWGSTLNVTMLATAVVFLGLFVFVESRAKEAIIPLDLFKNSIFTVSTITVFVTGMGLFGAIIYIPLFIQAIQGDSATNSGNALTPMMISVVVASVIAGQLISRTGKYRILSVVGMALVTLGMFLLFTMTADTPRLTTISYMIVVGLGMGVTFPIYTLVVQNAFPMSQVGVVSAALQFFRSIGSTVGTAVLGTVVANQFHDRLATEFAQRATTAGVPSQVTQGLLSFISNLSLQALGNPETLRTLFVELGKNLPADLVPMVQGALTASLKPALMAGIQESFLIGTLLLGVGLIATVFLKEIPLRKSNERPGMAMAEGGAPSVGQIAEMEGKEIMASGFPAGVVPARDEPELVRK
jgi:EmrB/QacA subfamily drug resistance transporter